LILLAVVFGYEDWIYSRRMPPDFLILSRLLLAFSAGIFAGGVLLIDQALLIHLSERRFKIAGIAASVFFGLALISGGVLLLHLSHLILSRDSEAKLWAMTYLIVGLGGAGVGGMASVRPCFTSGWRPSEGEAFVPPQEDLRPFVPPEPDLGSLLDVKRRLREQGRV
jgi:MFS family permease